MKEPTASHQNCSNQNMLPPTSSQSKKNVSTVMAAGEEGKRLGITWCRKTVVTGRSQVAISSRSGRKKFFSIGPWSAFCAGSCFYFGISFTLVLLKLHAKDPSHSAQSAGDSQLAPLVTGFSQFAAHSFTVSVQPQPAITSVRVNSLKHWQSCCCLDPKVPCTPILVTGMASAALTVSNTGSHAVVWTQKYRAHRY